MKASTPVAEDASVLIFADVLTPVKLEKMGNKYGIHNAHTFGRMEPHLKADYREAQLILPIDNGDVLIEWRSDDPGTALMNRELPLNHHSDVIDHCIYLVDAAWCVNQSAN
ncbi:Uncharacterised protein [Kluyvera cryocrescens]|uniref:Uncharacterized protein n=1 Tax=Kluyvera cryocrescens TaxID=580 RepID=A0A485C3K9_KLUCR|nr:Uncharacterised protein [Kluyvera cryocrescens]